MFKGGRPSDKIWQHFQRIDAGGKKYAKCKKCGHQQASNASRMHVHYEKCSKDGDNVQKHPVKRPRSRSRSRSPPRKQPALSVLIQDDMDCHVIKTSSCVQKTLDIEIAKLFYACNLPFSIADHPQFVKVVKTLRPGYTPPTRKTIGGSLLDTVTAELQIQMGAELQGKSATLVQDGWSNIHNEPVIATCLQVENKSFLLDSYDCGSMAKTADNCKELCLKSMKMAQEKYGCTVRSIVTDNAKNMERMRHALKSEDNDLIVYGCSAHWLNLLGEDLTPSAVMKHVVEIQKFFRNHHKPNAWLADCSDSIKPQIPGETRWKSQLMCLDSFIKNRSCYMKVVQDHEEDIDGTIARKIQDFNLFRNVRDLASQLRPVAVALDKCQADNCSLADACHVWLKLVSDPALQPHKSKVEKRFNQAILDEHLVAYMLHPKYRGENLSAEQLENVNRWMVEKDPSFMSFMVNFETKSSPFPPTFFMETIRLSPTTWWQAMKRYGVPLDFINLAVNILSAPASSASIERIFSNFGNIHTKVRNRLGNEKAFKLVFCYRMLRGGNELEY